MMKMSPGRMSPAKRSAMDLAAIIDEAVWEGMPSSCATMRGTQSQMAQEKSWTSANICDREVRIMVMPISRLMGFSRWKMTEKVIGSTPRLSESVGRVIADKSYAQIRQ